LARRGLEVFAGLRSEEPGDDRHSFNIVLCHHVLADHEACHHQCMEGSRVFGIKFLEAVAEMWADSLLGLFGKEGFEGEMIRDTAERSDLTGSRIQQIFLEAYTGAKKTRFLGPLASLMADARREDPKAVATYLDADKLSCATPSVLQVLFHHFEGQADWDEAVRIGAKLVAADTRVTPQRLAAVTTCICRQGRCPVSDDLFEIVRDAFPVLSGQEQYQEFLVGTLVRRGLAEPEDLLFSMSVEKQCVKAPGIQDLRETILLNVLNSGETR